MVKHDYHFINPHHSFSRYIRDVDGGSTGVIWVRNHVLQKPLKQQSGGLKNNQHESGVFLLVHSQESEVNMNTPGKGVIPQVHDPIPTLKVKFGCLYEESVFYRYAIESGWTGRPAEDKARELYATYKQYGFGSLFDTVKNWAISATNRN